MACELPSYRLGVAKSTVDLTRHRTLSRVKEQQSVLYLMAGDRTWHLQATCQWKGAVKIRDR